ncbi:MAG: hypothetical protein IJC63_00040 [Myxococcaceae bacterium]|nr:hypothetical protein [Myxococcaceae bacterium]
MNGGPRAYLAAIRWSDFIKARQIKAGVPNWRVGFVLSVIRSINKTRVFERPSIHQRKWGAKKTSAGRQLLRKTGGQTGKRTNGQMDLSGKSIEKQASQPINQSI